MIEMILLAELVIAVIALIIFIVRYVVVPRWYGTPEGRHFMALCTVFMIFFVMLVVHWRVVRVSPFGWVVVLGLIDAILCAQDVLLFRAQRRGKVMTVEHKENPIVVAEDARNRSWRTFVNGALWDLVIALVFALGPILTSSDFAFTGAYWTLVGTVALKTALMSATAFVGRYVRGEGPRRIMSEVVSASRPWRDSRLERP